MEQARESISQLLSSQEANFSSEELDDAISKVDDNCGLNWEDFSKVNRTMLASRL